MALICSPESLSVQVEQRWMIQKSPPPRSAANRWPRIGVRSVDSYGFEAISAAVISDAFALEENSADATNGFSTADDGCGCSVVAFGEQNEAGKTVLVCLLCSLPSASVQEFLEVETAAFEENGIGNCCCGFRAFAVACFNVCF